ncbi:hypothetical protein, partial [Pseudochrobactrum lubricantis]|uniref:hypothetical protein n=1 Tax=Pseudochrobactrum lubricantis TaxID=558172 RepID=UPI0035D908D3
FELKSIINRFLTLSPHHAHNRKAEEEKQAIQYRLHDERFKAKPATKSPKNIRNSIALAKPSKTLAIDCAA